MFIQHFVQIVDKATDKPISHFPCNNQEEAKHIEQAQSRNIDHQAFALRTVSAPALVSSTGNVLEIVENSGKSLIIRDNQTDYYYEIFIKPNKEIAAFLIWLSMMFR